MNIKEFREKEMNSLIFDYLIKHGYHNVAITFENEVKSNKIENGKIHLSAEKNKLEKSKNKKVVSKDSNEPSPGKENRSPIANEKEFSPKPKKNARLAVWFVNFLEMADARSGSPFYPNTNDRVEFIHLYLDSQKKALTSQFVSSFKNNNEAYENETTNNVLNEDGYGRNGKLDVLENYPNGAGKQASSEPNDQVNIVNLLNSGFEDGGAQASTEFCYLVELFTRRLPIQNILEIKVSGKYFILINEKQLIVFDPNTNQNVFFHDYSISQMGMTYPLKKLTSENINGIITFGIVINNTVGSFYKIQNGQCYEVCRIAPMDGEIKKICIVQSNIFLLSKDGRVSIYNTSGYVIRNSLFKDLYISNIEHFNYSLVISETSTKHFVEIDPITYKVNFSLHYGNDPIIIVKNNYLFLIENSFFIFNGSLVNRILTSNVNEQAIDFLYYNDKLVTLTDNLLHFNGLVFGIHSPHSMFFYEFNGIDSAAVITNDGIVKFFGFKN